MKAAKGNPTIWTGVNTLRGKVTDAAVARAFRMKYTALEDII